MSDTIQQVAAIYDIHGNLPALEAVLRDVDKADVDCIVVGGDIATGPMPCGVVNCLLALEMPVWYVQGNAERELVASFDGKEIRDVPDFVQEVIRWTAQQLGRSQRDFLGTMPATITLDVQGIGAVLFCHASPRSDTEIITVATPEDRVRPMLKNVNPSIIICGHTHMQFDRHIGLKRLLNAGSVGMGYGAPGACWALIGPEVTLMHTEYDLERAAKLILETEYPHAHDFALNNVLQPPSEAEAIQAFEPIPNN